MEFPQPPPPRISKWLTPGADPATEPAADTPPPRRTFLKILINAIGALFAVIFGAPIIAYLLDPLNRPKSESGFRTVDGFRLADLKVNQPEQGVIRNVRRDAWTLYPNDVVGRIWVVKKEEGSLAPGSGGLDEVVQLSHSLAEAEAKGDRETAARLGNRLQAKIIVFTTVCPHLGCSINLTPPAGFTCPCHGGKFDMNGQLLDKENNPAPRPMDTLLWIVSPQDPTLLQVKYANFQQTKVEKIEKT